MKVKVMFFPFLLAIIGDWSFSFGNRSPSIRPFVKFGFKQRGLRPKSEDYHSFHCKTGFYLGEIYIVHVPGKAENFVVL